MRSVWRSPAGRAVLMLGLANALHVHADSQAFAVADVLSATASYIADYEQQISAVVSEERYVQRIVGLSAPLQSVRDLRSDMLVVADERWGWVGFRDVFEVDGRSVRDRAERLSALFLKPGSDGLPQARRIMDEGSRFNLNIPGREITRNLNVPMMALMFIRRQNQPRSTFRIAGARTVDGERLVMVRFQEQASPRIIETIDSAAARGEFWIEPVSGRVVRTELAVDTLFSGATRSNDRLVSVVITAGYALQRNVGVWVPVSMTERYTMPQSATIQGHATYSNFRKFRVETTTDIKVP